MSSVATQSKYDCCGCAACQDACPVKCIEMVEDSESFIYPCVKQELCINCGKCLSVCPIKNSEAVKNAGTNDTAYAFVARDSELVKTSSSGGAFSAIMDAFCQKHKDFAIIGAAFDKTDVLHLCVNTRQEAEIFKKSKYVQSHCEHIYSRVKSELDASKSVLFSGTPCIVAALKRYLNKDYGNLTTVDIVCHGVPSRNIFKKYLRELESGHNARVDSASFRIKRGFDTDNTNPRTVDIYFDNNHSVNLDIQHCEYLYGFHTGLFFRPSCSVCKFASQDRPADITLGDYWGIEKLYPQLQSKRGVSLVRFNTQKGEEMLEHLKSAGTVYTTPYSFACDENEQLKHAAKSHRNRRKFFNLLKKGHSVIDAVNICKKPDNIFERILHKAEDIFKTAR